MSLSNYIDQYPAVYTTSANAVDEGIQASRQEKFTSSLVGPMDPETVDTKNVALKINSAYKVGPLEYCGWNDYYPQGTGSSAAPTFGDKVNINFGLDNCYNVRFELHFDVSDVTFRADGTTASNCEWAPWLAERLVGDEYQVRFQNDTLRKMDMDGLHFRRRLEEDFFSADAASYRQAVGASASPAAQHVWLPLDLGYTSDKPLPAVAQAHEHQLSFTIPSKESLIRYACQAANGVNAALAVYTSANNPINGTSIVPAQITRCFLRVHYTEHTQPLRLETAKYILRHGVKYKISEIEKNLSTTSSSFSAALAEDSAALITKNIPLSHTLASSYLIAVARFAGDLAPTLAGPNTTAVGDDFAAAQIAAYIGTQGPSPDRFRSMPLVSWAFKEGNTRHQPKTDWHYYATELHAKLFNSQISQPIGVIPFTKYPLSAHDHALGSVTVSNLNTPQLEITLQKVPDFGTLLGQSSPIPDLTSDSVDDARTDLDAVARAGDQIGIVIDVYSVAHNFLYLRNGRIFRAYS